MAAIRAPALFMSAEFNHQLIRTLGATVYGAADIGEVYAVASKIVDGDPESWWTQWRCFADRLRGIGEQSAKKGKNVSARSSLVRACVYYRTAEFFLRDRAADPRLKQTSDDLTATFRQVAALSNGAIQPVGIPYEGVELPGYFYTAEGSGSGRKPTIIFPGGQDSYAEDFYYSGAIAAQQRGYHALVFDGPGQGHALRQLGLPFRPDWERVTAPVIDWLSARDDVDAAKLVLLGTSFGGMLCARAAAFESRRLAGVVLNPGQYDCSLGIKKMLAGPLASLFEQGNKTEFDKAFNQLLDREPGLRFKVEARMPAQGTTSYFDWVHKMLKFHVRDCADLITCPTLICYAEEEHLSTGQARLLYDAMTECPKKALHVFSAAEGAGDHCQALTLARSYQVVFDWCFDVLGK